jgi:hypothetical protein
VARGVVVAAEGACEDAEEPRRGSLDDHADASPRPHPIPQREERAVHGFRPSLVSEARARLGQVPKVRTQARQEWALRRKLLEHRTRRIEIALARLLERSHRDAHQGVVGKTRRDGHDALDVGQRLASREGPTPRLQDGRELHLQRHDLLSHAPRLLRELGALVEAAVPQGAKRSHHQREPLVGG